MTRLSGQLVGALTLVTIAGCGVTTQKNPTRLDNNNVHVVGRIPSTTIFPGTPTDRAMLCFVSDDRLFTIARELPAPLSVHRALAALIDLARTGLPVGTRSVIAGADIANAQEVSAATRIALVGLKSDFAQRSPRDQILALAQVVCTLTSVPGVRQVQFTLNGEPVDIPRADGSLTHEPVSQLDYRALFPTS